MKTKTLVLLGLAVVCGLVASFMTSRLLAQRNNAPQEDEEKVTVYVAKMKLAYGTKLDVPENFFEERQVNPDSVPKEAILNLDDLKDRYIKEALSEQGIVTKNSLIPVDMVGIRNMPPGKRAVALQSNAVATAGGLILPRYRVDVMLTTATESKVILSDMLVLAVDTIQKVDQNNSAIIPQTVTLEADPEQAAILALAQSKGKIQLTIRPLNDHNTNTINVRVTDQDLGSKGANSRVEEAAAGGTDLTSAKQIPLKEGSTIVEKTPEGSGSPEATPVVKKKKAFERISFNGTEKLVNYFDDETGKAILAAELDQYDVPGKQ